MPILRLIILATFFASGCIAAQTPAIPVGLVATGYECHVELTWTPSTESFLSGYKIFKAAPNSSNFIFVKQVGKVAIATDWTCDEG